MPLAQKKKIEGAFKVCYCIVSKPMCGARKLAMGEINSGGSSVLGNFLERGTQRTEGFF